ncbi:MAG TPA: bifunctional DNA primase/polymerase [Actinoplanes sp.]|nr:bifunctional DNA primase/polymerase [Actinoplanes sp.]
MLLTAALAYARHGIPVLPVHNPVADGGCSCDRAGCDRPGKHPRLCRGLTDASTDPRRIEMWWSRWPDANVGLRTGVVMDVADVDSAEGRHGLWHLLGGAPSGPAIRTGGGWHFWFRPTGYGNRVRLLPGLDWRGAGGYVVAPPSRHANGSTYTWFRRPGDLLPGSPPVLRELIVGPAIFHDDRRVADPDRSAAAASRYDDRPIAYPDRYAVAALEAETDRVARAPVGTRNDTLNRAAFALGRLAGAGLLDAREVAYELAAAARHAGLGRAEIRRTIRSGLTAGQQQPLDRMRSIVPRVA